MSLHALTSLRPFPAALAAVALAALTACGKTEAPAPAATPAAAPASAASAAAAPSGPAREVGFAVVAPITGPIAHIGKDVHNGVRMALEEVNAAHLVIGGQPIQFKLLAEDDAGEPRQATAVAQKLCDTKAVAVVGHLQSGTTIPASAVYAECGIPTITPSATSPELNKAGHKTLFRMIANDNQLGAGVAEQAMGKLGVKTLALVDDRTAFGQGLTTTFQRVADQHGAKVVATEYTTDKATDFQAILTSIKAKKPDAILFGGLDAQAGPMLRQMAQLGMNDIKFFGGDGTCTPRLPELAGNAPTLANVVCATGGATMAKLPGGEAWMTRYEEKYPKQFQIYSPYAYAAAMVLVDAMKQADSTDPKVYLPKLAAIQSDGLTGKVSFTPEGERNNPTITYWTYKDGKLVEWTAP